MHHVNVILLLLLLDILLIIIIIITNITTISDFDNMNIVAYHLIIYDKLILTT